MDNLTHGLFGVAMARAGLARERPWAVPLLAVAANAPDFESLVPAGSTANYLLYHRGISHSVMGVFMEAGVLTLATLAILKFWRGRKNDSTPLPKVLTVYVIAWLGAASHVLLDWFNSYGVWPWRPFSDAVYYGDFVFIIDPWFWLLLWGGCYLAAPVLRSTRVTYGFIAGVMVAVLAWAVAREIMTGAMLAGWIFVAALVFILPLRFNWDIGERAGKPNFRMAQVGLGLLAVYLSGLYGLSRSAKEKIESGYAHGPLPITSVHPTPAMPWRFVVLMDLGTTVERSIVNTFSGKVERGTEFVTNRDDPALALIRETQEYRAWMYFARHRVAVREGNTLVLGDARYRIWDGRPDWTEMRVPLPTQQPGPKIEPAAE